MVTNFGVSGPNFSPGNPGELRTFYPIGYREKIGYGRYLTRPLEAWMTANERAWLRPYKGEAPVVFSRLNRLATKG